MVCYTNDLTINLQCTVAANKLVGVTIQGGKVLVNLGQILGPAQRNFSQSSPDTSPSSRVGSGDETISLMDLNNGCCILV